MRKHRRGRRYDMVHKNQAEEIVRSVKAYTGRNLSDQMKQQCDEYASEILGSKRFAPWLYVYTIVSGRFAEGWMPDNFFGRLVVPNVNKSLGVLSDYKSFSNAVLKSAALPDIGYFVNGVLYNNRYSTVDLSKFRKIASEHCDSVFLKQDGSERGEGIKNLLIKDLSLDILRQIGNCSIQAPVKQHDFFDQIVEGSVATVRITTVREIAGNIKVRAAYLRVGRAGDKWVQSNRLLRIGIRRGGELDSVCYMPDWCHSIRHPDTGFEYEGSAIPSFNKAASLCIDLHSTLLNIAIIGWDVAIEEKGQVKILEWNTGHCDIKFSEAVSGPCFLGLEWERYGL